MEFESFGSKYIVRLDKGEEIVETLKKFCKEHQIYLGFIRGIGEVNKATIGLFKTQTKQYQTKVLSGDYEITSLLGNISTLDDEVYLHLHINLSDEEYKVYGGHLSSGIISATGEIIIEAMDGKLSREFNEECGINLYKF